MSEQNEPKNDLRQQRGQQGENEAVRFLEARGFRVIARNWRPGQKNAQQNSPQPSSSNFEYSKNTKRAAAADGAMRGEIDIIAWHGRVLCFIEVKTRNLGSGIFSQAAPQEAVTFSKQKQISRLANAYVSFFKLHDVPCRFDVVEVWHEPNRETRVQLHEGAFDYVDPSYGARLASRNRRF